ncbi:MAG TPA: hypothetical protein ENI73_09585 [Spirochaetes bacterium]|nr:hypothetical protein [Spirochaetota bacterium]
MEKYDHLRGGDSPALNGGYIYIYKNGIELHIVSVPSPNLLGERHSDTLVDNYEDFEDGEGNEYSIDIFSSNIGVDWELEVIPKNPAEEDQLIESLTLKYEENPF